MSDRIASFVELINGHLNNAKWMLQHAAIQMTVMNNRNKSSKIIDVALENIERSQRGLMRWLQYIGRVHLIEDFDRITGRNLEMYNTTKETLAQAHAELERAIVAGDAFLDDPRTTDRESKGLDQVINAMEDAAEPLEAFL